MVSGEVVSALPDFVALVVVISSRFVSTCKDTTPAFSCTSDADVAHAVEGCMLGILVPIHPILSNTLEHRYWHHNPDYQGVDVCGKQGDCV
jgi:hypothetical protein